MTQLRQSLADYRVMSTAANGGGRRSARRPDDSRGGQRLKAVERAAAIHTEAEYDVRRLALEAAGLDPGRPVTTAVAVQHINGILVVVAPHPDDPARDVLVVVDPLFLIVASD
jgi:hypothetical protein